ncbi:hypothetical protein GCM10009624_00590 [Gordonia sinesedis]
MAKESGTDDSAPDSRPISVAELLARSQGTGATGAEQKSQGRGRRRVGRDGSVSVSELTGEIPRIADPADTPGTGAGPTSNRPAPTTGATPTRPTGSPAAPGTPPPAPASQQAPPPAPAAPGTGGGAPAHPAGPASAPRRPAPAGPGSGTFPTSPPSGSFGAAGPRSAPFPRSENPVARRTPGDRAVGDTTGSGTRTGLGRSTASGMPGFDRPPGTRDFNAGDVANRLGAPAGAGRGSQPPASSDPADTASANAVTGIIPVVGDGDPDLVVVETDDVEGADLGTPPTAPSSTTRGSGFAEVMDDDFEAYRSFADVEKDADEQPKPKRRRWFGRKKKDRASGAAVAGAAGAAGVGAAAAAATSRAAKAKRDADAPADTARTDTARTAVDTARTGADAGAADTRTGTSPAEAARDAVTEVTVDEKRTGLTGRGVEVTDTAATVSASATDSTTAPDSTIGDDPAVGDATGTRPRSDDARGAADRAPAAFGESTLGNLVSPARADDGAAWGRPADRETVGSDPAGPATARAATPDTTVTDTPTTDAADDAPGADPTKADATRADRKADRKAARKADRKRGDTDTDTDDDTSSRRRFSDSPVMAWLSVFAQVVVGLAVGVGLFWGFIELWKWNVYFALVLAVVVIFGIVTLTHLVRRNRDLPTTLLALAVGLVVTLGPLVVLLSA